MKAKKMISLILCGVMLLMPSVVYADEISGEASFNVDDSHEAFGDRGGRGDRGGMAGNGGGMRGGMGGSVENDPEAQAVIDEVKDKFTQSAFTDPETGTELEYSLFVPEGYEDGQEYPLIMFIPDATGSGKTARELVEQYYGGDIWATEAEQEKHPSFVLVPAFSETVTDDNWNTSDEIETVVKLISFLQEEYSIDSNRIYTTGQSMGCMTSLYLNSRYPDLFAASLFVSGQWDISVLSPLEDAKFFYITAGGDEKASGGQTEVMNMLDADSVPYSYGTWDAQDSAEEQDAATQALLDEGNNANFIRFETGTVLSSGQGMEHMASFNYAYKIEAVRDWLFQQS